jgi:hypothetical protein
MPTSPLPIIVFIVIGWILAWFARDAVVALHPPGQVEQLAALAAEGPPAHVSRALAAEHAQGIRHRDIMRQIQAIGPRLGHRRVRTNPARHFTPM